MTNSKPQKGTNSWLLPDLTDIESARSAARQGTAVCVLIIIFSLVIATLSGVTQSSAFAATVALYGLVAFLIYRMSRIGSVMGLIIYLIDRLMIVAKTGISGNLVITILFIFAFINSVRGTFAYHRFRH
ncbi:hypothetical protein [Allocoleopsis sp.]|uniref:hypothetical protein n=1 Tax=Allocoleopsis sp. TaxID=3088169 RepID=UPI002FCED1CC